MTDKEALLLALEALHYCEALNRDVDERKMQAITVIRKLWAQPEQEPVAWWNDTGTHIDLNVSGRGIPLYTHPPQRTEQLKACVYCGQLVVKEKNT